MVEINNTPKQIRLPIYLAICVVAGILLGRYLGAPQPVLPAGSGPVAKFREVLTSIEQNYVDSVNSQQLTDIAIENMLKELDPHTTYMPASQLELSNMHLKGGYDGIGIQFDIIRDTLVVVRAIPGGPAYMAGLRTGDRILAVEGEPLSGTGIYSRDVTERLLGKAGSKVEILVWHYDNRRTEEIELQRARIPQPTVVASYMLSPTIGYIKLVSFGRNSYNEFKQALQDLLDQGMEKLIFDLQGNGGGYMAAAERIADELLGGDVLIVSQKGKTERYNNEVKAGKKGIFEEQPLILLQDEYSASAAEIVAGALQDNDRALIVGRRSYGKGLVQMPITLVDGSELRLTIARYYTPSGRSIQKPYVKGENADYAHDLVQRFEHGEFYVKDSIHLNDSLRYSTLIGRTVYGGGGIMPDYFVPYDSTLNTDCYNDLVANRIVREFTLNYYLQHQVKLEKLSLEEFIRDFQVTKAMMDELWQMARQNDIMLANADCQTALPHLKAYIKGEIGRLLWGDDGFYPVYNAVSNKTLLEALNLFDEASQLLAESRQQIAHQ